MNRIGHLYTILSFGVLIAILSCTSDSSHSLDGETTGSGGSGGSADTSLPPDRRDDTVIGSGTPVEISRSEQSLRGCLKSTSSRLSGGTTSSAASLAPRISAASPLSRFLAAKAVALRNPPKLFSKWILA